MVKKSTLVGVLDVEISLLETSDYLIKKIAKARDIPSKRVSDILKYNVISAQQLEEITESTRIRALLMPRPKKGDWVVDLDRCYPFPVNDDNDGFVLIVRNDKCENFIKESLK